MDFSAFKDIVVKPEPEIFKSFESVDNQQIDLDDLSRPIFEQLNPRDALTPLGESDKDKLYNTEGYSEAVVERIGSQEEAEIYCDANLECTQIDGKDALIRTDIDYAQTDDFGRTNLERMEKGLSPLDTEGKSIELHHIGQSSDAPLAELTWSEHHANGNDTVLHDKQKESEIDRTAFGKERAEHWQNRAELINQSNLES